MRYTLYFAYGSNMYEPQFRQRCPDSFVLGRATLPGYRFIITSNGYASVLQKTGSTVYGLLYALTEADEQELDRREGVAQNDYRREFVQVITDSGYLIPALIYIDNVEAEGVPKPGYLEKILAGAEHHQLPSSAVAELKRWAKANV